MSTSVIDLGNLTKPATVLIEKISAAVGVVFEPHQVRRMAQAEADAALIRAENEIQITDLHRRAMRRFVEEEAKRQANIESVSRTALTFLRHDADPASVSDDWITNFFDKCRIVSEQDMQQIWGQLLAAEASAPGTFSRQTVNLLGNMGTSDAELFERLVALVWKFPDRPHLFFWNYEPLCESHLSYDEITLLESLGLIQYNAMGLEIVLEPHDSAQYNDTNVDFKFPESGPLALDAGNVILTRPGEQLSRICNSTPINGVVELALKRWPTAQIRR